MRPLSPRQSLSSTAVTSGSGRPVHSARSEAGWAIFVFERVTRKRKQVGGDGLLGGGELAERLEQVVLDDLLRAAERLEPGQVERVRAGRDRRAPEPLEHELEERRLDRVGARRVRRRRRRRPR